VQGKIIFVLGVATGYVVGTRVGRQGYESLKKQAAEAKKQAADVWHDPRVQKTVANAGEFARDKIPVVGDFVGDLTTKASAQVDAAAGKHLADSDADSAPNPAETATTSDTASADTASTESAPDSDDTGTSDGAPNETGNNGERND
jgi:hypothetical protein